ncbi:YkgJ family cysteine cluster protein [Nitrogeniibacter aestuarii]|uniref:YkgJ family cysteine cluster protein n=1 Tax=Nitrogeniibacter aestuarii TaxID=2815343 RepID=UPI001E2BF3E0|nr:YkgJ family cysteine cluster protein [Nitrogeniibacter aestuarii]
MTDPNPCLGCGLCCTHFRVSFYWAEGDDAPGGYVPAHLTEKVNDFYRCMKGTGQAPRRCHALEGQVGESVACRIYEQRPSPCREFEVYLENGEPNPRCNELRLKAGLSPLEWAPMPSAA